MCAQNAGAMLSYWAARDEEFREAIAAQMETILGCIVSHLMSGQTGLEHNAALLLGYCSTVSAEFRECFWHHDVAGDAMITKWIPLLTSNDHGVVTNVLWALAVLCSNLQNPGVLEGHGWQQVIAIVNDMVEHPDERVKVHARTMVRTVQSVQQKVFPVNTQTCGGGATGLRREKSMLAVNALAQLTKQESPSPKNDNSPPYTPMNSDTAAHNDDAVKPQTTLSRSPKGRRQSLLAPWKKTEKRFKVTAKGEQNRSVSSGIPEGHCAELSSLLSAAITQAAEG